MEEEVEKEAKRILSNLSFEEVTRKEDRMGKRHSEPLPNFQNYESPSLSIELKDFTLKQGQRGKLENTPERKMSHKSRSLVKQKSSGRILRHQSYVLRKASRDSLLSPKAVTLIRDNSCSLISIPQYGESECSSMSDISPWTSSLSRPRKQLVLTSRTTTTSTSRVELQAACITLSMFIVVLGLMGLIIVLIRYLTGNSPT